MPVPMSAYVDHDGTFPPIQYSASAVSLLIIAGVDRRYQLEVSLGLCRLVESAARFLTLQMPCQPEILQ